MTTPDRELLRPEDAASLEEFQARRVVEQANIRAMNSSWATIGRIALSGFICFAALFCWIGVVTIHDAARWFYLTLALILTLSFLRIFGRIELRGVRGSKRYMQLNRLSKEWQVKAARGEIPRTAPAGPKVWRDELDGAKTQGT